MSQDWKASAKYLSAGAIAGAVSRTATAPLERLKIFRQVQDMRAASATNVHYQGIVRALIDMGRKEGLRGYFKGNGTNCVKVVPASAIRFLSFESLKTFFLDKGTTQLSTGHKLVCGSMAGVIATGCTYPLDLIRTRLSLQVAEKHYNGIVHAFTSIVRSNGIRGLYRGAGTALTSVAPFSALNFTAYETIKEVVGPRIKSDSRFLNAAYGASSGTFAMTILYPLDLLKRRLMVQGHGGVEHRYRNGWHAAATIVKEEGVRALYKGIVPSYYKVIPTVSLTWYTYEICKDVFELHRKK